MILDDVIPYIEDINDIDVAKTLLELELQPDGYYSKIYNEINYLLKHNIDERVLKTMFKNYEKHMAIKYVQHLSLLYDEIKGDKIHSLIHKKTLLKSIMDISDIYSLRLYLTMLNKKFKGQDINYKKYVPEFKLKEKKLIF